MILRDSRLTRHPSCLTNGVHLKLPVGSHVLFFRVTGGGEIDVVRILHQRMDVAKRFED